MPSTTRWDPSALTRMVSPDFPSANALPTERILSGPDSAITVTRWPRLTSLGACNICGVMTVAPAMVRLASMPAMGWLSL